MRLLDCMQQLSMDLQTALKLKGLPPAKCLNSDELIFLDCPGEYLDPCRGKEVHVCDDTELSSVPSILDVVHPQLISEWNMHGTLEDIVEERLARIQKPTKETPGMRHTMPYNVCHTMRSVCSNVQLNVYAVAATACDMDHPASVLAYRCVYRRCI